MNAGAAFSAGFAAARQLPKFWSACAIDEGCFGRVDLLKFV